MQDFRTNGGIPNSWLVWNRESENQMGELEVRPIFGNLWKPPYIIHHHFPTFK